MTAQVSPNGTLLQTWASSGDVTTPAQPTIDQGWSLGQKPPHGTMNWIHNEQQQKINHILQHGVSFWDNATGYVVGDLVNLNGVVYKALTANTAITPVAGGNSTWAVYQKSLSSGSSAITISESVNNTTSTIDVSGSGLVSKFEDSDTVTWVASNEKAKASQKQLNTSKITNQDYTFTVSDNGKIFYVSASSSNVTLTLPSRSTVGNNWRVTVVFSAINNNVEIALGDTGNNIIYDQLQNNEPVTFQDKSSGTMLIHGIFDDNNSYSVSGEIRYLPIYIQNTNIPAISSISGNISLEIEALSVIRINGVNTIVNFSFIFPNLLNTINKENISINLQTFLQTLFGIEFTGYRDGQITHNGTAEPLSSGTSINLGNPIINFYGQNTRSDQSVGGVVSLLLDIKNPRII